MTKRIYVATDYLRPAGEPLELGALLSRSTGAQLALVVVRPYRALTPEVGGGSFGEALRQHAESGLAESVKPLRQRGLEVTGEAVVSASVPRGLQEVSERADAGVLVAGPTRHWPLGRLLLGTTATHLLHGARCPVAVPPRGFRAPEHAPLRIGVAYDGAAEADVALTEAAALARTTGARLRVIAVAEPPTSFVTAGVPGYDYGALAWESRQDLEQRLGRAVDAQSADLAVEHELHEGAAVAILAEATRALDLLVCGSRGYGAVRGVLLGSVSRRLIGAASCPVAVVPSGNEPALGALGAPLKPAG